MFPAFEKATGIKVNFNEQPDQDAMFAQAKVALQTGGIDVVEPTVDRRGGWASNGLVQGWNETSCRWTTTCPASPTAMPATLAHRRQAHISAVHWGTEAIVSKRPTPRSNTPPSLGDLFDPRTRSCVRPHSTLAAMGRWLDARASCRSRGSTATRTRPP